MGGYYNEPEEDDTVTAQNTHMVYGIRCVEQTVSLSPTIHVTLLQPVDDEQEALLAQEQEVALALYLLDHYQGMLSSLSQQRVAVLEGSGLVSLELLLLLAQQSPDAVVLACSVDTSSLQRIQMAHVMNASSSWRGATLETGTCIEGRFVDDETGFFPHLCRRTQFLVKITSPRYPMRTCSLLFQARQTGHNLRIGSNAMLPSSIWMLPTRNLFKCGNTHRLQLFRSWVFWNNGARDNEKDVHL